MESGCETLNNLWKIAIQCNIDKPGITGTIDRTIGFVQCANIRDFMVMATLKCWHERENSGLPPIIVKDTNIKYIEKHSSSESKFDNFNKK